MIQVLKAMIVREIQEHKVAFVYAPFFVSFILCFVIASVYFGGTSIRMLVPPKYTEAITKHKIKDTKNGAYTKATLCSCISLTIIALRT